jgi:outer membrane receptor protein involved in Fe transport
MLKTGIENTIKQQVSMYLVVVDGTEIRPSLADEFVHRHPDSVIFDCNIAYTIRQKYTVAITAANLLDENYTEKDGYNMPGRLITAKFSYRFYI